MTDTQLEAYIKVVKQVKQKYIKKYGPHAADWFGV